MLAEEKISELVKQKYVRLTNRGNSAIKHAIRVIKKINMHDNKEKDTILIPDQGGWITYSQFAKKEKFKVKEIDTDSGIINPKILELKNIAAFIITQPAGYFAKQDIKSIYKVCKKEGCLLILDITGSIGDYGTGEYADITLASFSKEKPVDLGYGGYISFKSSSLYEVSQEILLPPFDIEKEKELVNKLNNLEKRYKMFNEVRTKIKQDLSDFDIIHPEKQGINVIVRFKSLKEKEEIIKYCNNNKLTYTTCPRNIRVLDDAISIEVKRL